MAQLDAGLPGGEVPVDFWGVGIPSRLPRCHGLAQQWLGSNPPIRALARQHGEFAFGDIEPRPMLGRVMPFKALGQSARCSRRKPFIQTVRAMRI